LFIDINTHKFDIMNQK